MLIVVNIQKWDKVLIKFYEKRTEREKIVGMCIQRLIIIWNNAKCTDVTRPFSKPKREQNPDVNGKQYSFVNVTKNILVFLYTNYIL